VSIDNVSLEKWKKRYELEKDIPLAVERLHRKLDYQITKMGSRPSLYGEAQPLKYLKLEVKRHLEKLK